MLYTHFGLSVFLIQGVPRNMTVAIRLESRLRSLNLLVTLSRQPTLTCMILETKTANSPSPGISKTWSAFFCFQYYPSY